MHPLQTYIEEVHMLVQRPIVSNACPAQLINSVEPRILRTCGTML